MSGHPNATRAREGFASFSGAAQFAPEAVWHVPGRTSASGDYRGLEEIVPFLRRTAELTNGTYRVDLLWVVADDTHAVAVYRARGSRPDGRELDIEQALLIELRDGLWTDIRAQPLDQAAFEAFWSD